jgi:hypothetical protein
VVEVIAQLDLSELSGAYAGRGMAAHHPEVLLGLLVYGVCDGRVLEPQARASDL